MSSNAVNLDRRTYKELQELAKACSIPANIRKEQLVRAIKAHYEKNEEILQGVLDEVKTARAKRRKPKVPPRSKSKSKDKSSNDSSDDNVDSTSGGITDLVPFNPYPNSYPNSHPSSDRDVDQSYAVDRRLYPRQHSAYLDNAVQYDSRLNYSGSSSLPSNMPQSNYAESSNAMVPYNGLRKDTVQNYCDYSNSNYPSYHASSYYRQSCPSFSWMENPNSYFSMHDSYYASQLPATKLFEPKIVIDCTKSFSVSQRGYYDAESNGVPSMDVDCSSNLLPNVPQLDTSSSWNQNAAAPTYPNRVQFSSTDIYTYQQNEHRDESYNFPAADNESISAEVDSASEADNRSLADDIADLLSMDNVDMEQDPADISLLMPSEFSESEQSSSTSNNERAYYAGSNRDNYANTNFSTNDASATPAWSQSSQNVENADTTVALPGSQTSQVETRYFQLPTFSTLLGNKNSSATPRHEVYSDYQLPSQEPRYVSPPNYSQLYSKSASCECTPGCSQESGYAGTEGTLSSSTNGVSRVERDEDTSYQDDQSQNEYSEIIDLDMSPETTIRVAPVWYPSPRSKPDTTLAHECTTYKIENRNGYDGAETEDEDDVVIVETPPSNVATTRSGSRNEACSQTSEASGLIYKKETLHRSKIVCDSTATNNITENVMRESVKIVIPTEGQKAIFSQTTTRKLISDTVSNSSYNARQIVKKHLANRTCWYKPIGCTYEAKSQLVAMHEKRCKFRTIYCPSESCSWREPFNGLTEHITNVHKEQILNRRQFLYTIDRVLHENDQSFYTFYQTYKDTIYVIRVHMDEDKCVATVQYIPDVQGTTIRTRNLRGIMEFVAFPDKRRVKIWKGFIQPYSDTIDKRPTFNTMRMEMGGIEFLALYVCIC